MRKRPNDETKERYSRVKERRISREKVISFKDCKCEVEQYQQDEQDAQEDGLASMYAGEDCECVVFAASLPKKSKMTRSCAVV